MAFGGAFVKNLHPVAKNLVICIDSNLILRLTQQSWSSHVFYHHICPRFYTFYLLTILRLGYVPSSRHLWIWSLQQTFYMSEWRISLLASCSLEFQLPGFLTRNRRQDHISPVRAALEWLPVCFGIDFNILLITLKALCGMAASYLSDLLMLAVPVLFSLRRGLYIPENKRGRGRFRSGRRSYRMMCPRTSWVSDLF